MDSTKRFVILAAFATAVLLPATAAAEFLGFYARGHGSYLMGPEEKLPYFKNNDAVGYGFAIGAELVQVDVFLDANFRPDGSAWNQLGIGWDMDFMPGPVFIEPGAQLVYFFGKQADGSDAVNGLFPRIGVQVGAEFLKVVYAGVEAWGGYVISLPDPETGLVFMSSAYLGIRFNVF